ncbi:Down syndrome cell adhesion molecule-like protein 1, partial [Stegodyphus mimosarum]
MLWKSVLGEDALKIQPFSFPAESVIGKRVSATCTPSAGEKMDFKWLKNGKELVSGRKNINILSYPFLSALVIDPLTTEDSGNYTCVVSTRGLVGSYTTTLDVLVPPTWKIIPEDHDAVNGETLMLHCQGSGRPQPVTTWSRTFGLSNDFVALSASNR